ncbi:putative DMT superfamily transporter inner membrane protein [Vibrio alginolyticus]|uniref:Putative DMT superfamily transporter inner membrane protein n=1 Tax=Vibrio alginolyticus TaxID=663 RepID=A0A1W6UKS6_VIBAL|nr:MULTISPECIES: EamA family transporter [Vibrio]MCF7510470.1 EamA family transporter [Vibrio sp. D54]MDG2788839.1 EamA family transporter [Vibrio parahaemolyticus]NAW95600.1 EamA family transporter [Vibrio sp. V42_P2S4T144]ARO98665.1 putative DMT superfamily transporter inner membrane protein [Vibrio alginolyticus]ARP03382.1 putative DMT superfamily transporter inner membrane protein [Vibrio alginolyticus]
MLKKHFTDYQLGTLSILFASTLWGTTGTAASLAPDVSALAIGAFSMGIGGFMQACLSAKSLKRDFRKVVHKKKTLLVSIIALATYPLAFYSSMRFAGVAIGTVVSISTAPFFSALLECLFSRNQTITKRWMMSFAIGVIGITLLLASESSANSLFDQDMKHWGVLLGLLAGLTYAIYSWGVKAMIDHGIESQTAMGSVFGIGGVLLLPTLFITGDNLFASSTNTTVMLYMALIPMGLGYVAFGFGLRFVTASGASILTLFEPVIAAALAVAIVGEEISFIGWVGITLTLVCLFLQSKS